MRRKASIKRLGAPSEEALSAFLRFSDAQGLPDLALGVVYASVKRVLRDEAETLLKVGDGVVRAFAQLEVPEPRVLDERKTVAEHRQLPPGRLRLLRPKALKQLLRNRKAADLLVNSDIFHSSRIPPR